MLYIATLQPQTNSTTNDWIVELGATGIWLILEPHLPHMSICHKGNLLTQAMDLPMKSKALEKKMSYFKMAQ